MLKLAHFLQKQNNHRKCLHFLYFCQNYGSWKIKDRQILLEKDRYIFREIDRQIFREIDRQIFREVDRQIET